MSTHYGQPVKDAARIARIWERTEGDRAISTTRRRAIAEFNAAHRHTKRGLAITPVKFGISFTATFFNQAGALVLVYRDGSVQVNHGGTEMGQGLHTKIRQIAAESLGVRCRSDSDHAHAHRQGAEHVGHGGFGGHRSEWRGGAGCLPADSSAADTGRGAAAGMRGVRVGSRRAVSGGGASRLRK